MRRAKGRGKRADMGMLVAETATRLRSGATPEGAWRQTLERAGLGWGRMRTSTPTGSRRRSGNCGSLRGGGGLWGRRCAWEFPLRSRCAA